MCAYYGGYYKPQPTVEDIRIKAIKAIKQLQKKGINVNPVETSGSKIVTTWWGKAWCNNLESYADYSNRLSRGKKYVKAGAVIDLEIIPGQITAKVSGSKVYDVVIYIDSTNKTTCDNIINQFTDQMPNMEQLINGEFPEKLKELFCCRNGLFPTPNEIHFHCSCPDWASMCKHVAAVLYATGTRLDENPSLFFKLRSIEIDTFINHAIQSNVDKMLANVDLVKSNRIIKNEDNIPSIFGLK